MMNGLDRFDTRTRILDGLDVVFRFSREKGAICLLLFVVAAGLHWGLYHLAPPGWCCWGELPLGVGLLPATFFVLGTLVLPVYVLSSLVYTTVRTQPPAAYLRLRWRTLLLIPAFILGVFLHNFNYALFFDHFSAFGGDEAVFFIVSLLLLPAYLLVSIVYTWLNWGEPVHFD
jgi:hypothetical protein